MNDNKRVQLSPAGQVELKLPTPWRDGTTHLVVSPLEFMQRLAALVPQPRLPSANDCFAAVNLSGRMTVPGRYGELCIAKSVYLARHQSQPNAPMLEAPDRPRWTEAPRGGVGVGLLGNVRFRRVFWEARAGRRWWKGS